MPVEMTANDSWRIFRIMAEFVEGMGSVASRFAVMPRLVQPPGSAGWSTKPPSWRSSSMTQAAKCASASLTCRRPARCGRTS